MKWFWCNISFFLFIPFLSLAQGEKQEHYASLLKQLETEVSKGNLIALRDLGTLLDKSTVANEAERILKNYTFFLDEEWVWKDKIDRQAFLNFFYTNKNQIRFFHPAEVFYIAALDVEKIDYKIESFPKNLKTEKTVLLRKSINAFEKAIAKDENKKTERALKRIIELNSRESRQYLLQVMQKETIQKSYLKGKINLLLMMATELQNHPTLETLQEILENIEKGFLPFKESKLILAHLTNHSLAEMNDGKKGVKYFSQLVDSLETMENIRYAGYENIFDFNKYIFPHEVDYFGRIVNLTNNHPWMKRNAIRDLLATEHERAYLYLASDFYKNYLAKSVKNSKPTISLKEYQNFFTESNQLIIKVLGKNKTFQNIFEETDERGCKDPVLMRNFLLYWLTHHADYEWSQGYNLYINKFEILAKTENLEKLFRRLNSTNDEVAMESFRKITEGSPTEVLNLANKYRQLLRSYNNTLPNIRHQYIEQLSLLTDFCRNNKVSYLPSKRLKQKLDHLQEKIPYSERYELENRIINSLDLNEVTAVEYYACLFENNNDFTYSVGRILDHFYSQHWNLILQNDNQLRLFLKKSALFKRIGTIGSANLYLTKLESQTENPSPRLKEILEVEPDDDIIFLIDFLQPEEKIIGNSDLEEFTENPTDFSKNDIRVLPSASPEVLQAIIYKMQKVTDVKILKKYLEYLRRNPQILNIPLYFQLIENQTVMGKKYGNPITLADLMIPIIEDAYDHQYTPSDKAKLFATDKWKNLWKTDGKNYKSWVTLFFEQKLKQLEYSEKIKIDVINKVFSSEYYRAKYKEDCLKALAKVRPFKKIKKLKTKEKLSVKNDLKYFENFFFSYKDLDDIPKLFEVDDPELLFDYLLKRTTDFDVSELGTFWNSVFRQNWFLEFLNSKNNHRLADFEYIKIALENYLNESDLISEYEEQTTNLNIHHIESFGKGLVTSLKESIHSKKDNATKALIQQSILARASYQDIGEIVSIIDQLSSSQNFQPLLFLQKDFGLPIFNLEDKKMRAEIVTHHSKMTEYDFYNYYLKSFGIDYLTKKNKLDFQKIYDLVQFEIVTPFVGGGGGHRDQFTYGLIKLLEIHFKTRLGFDEKFNENQTFYTFTNTKRANAWRSYLIESQLVIANNNLPPSFNDVVNNR